MSRRKVAIFTGNRAEYGLQFPILRAVQADPRLEMFLLVGGAHLQQDFGSTESEIANDGFRVHRRVKIEMAHDTLHATAQAIGTGVVSVSEILDELRPDWLVVYGDRYEAFSALIAGTQMGIPTAHVEGGDYTEGGALDDTVRHAMTKLAHLHFTTNETAAERVRKLGEEPWRIMTVGLPALDLAAAGDFAAPDALAEELGLDPARPVVLFCQHSVATEADDAVRQILPALAALARLAADGMQVVITYPNNDAGGRRIIKEIDAAFGTAYANVQVHKSLGRFRFHGALNLIGRVGRGAFIGNSSALIKETPFFGCPAINVGPRQQGRLRGDNVIDVGYDEAAIYAAVQLCARDEAFRAQCRACRNPYGAGNAGPRIADVLATRKINGELIQKKMTY
jgi:UDP-N-acetylglucosamine 2-epimerase (non-hydrolysing)/GDP/UDP-N,N'-diacetylbacillosamine 2-epimerase (hydrolysing)